LEDPGYARSVVAFVINLPHSVERRRHMDAQVADLEHEFVDAVDGRYLSTEGRPEWLRPTILGCTLSHRAVYQRVIEEDLPYALVLEDDMVLPPDIRDLAEAVANELEGREAGLLYYRALRKCPMAADPDARLPGDRRLLSPIDPTALIASGAYVISRAACAAMVDSDHNQPDNWGEFVASGLLERVRCVVPRPVSYRTDFKSTVDYGTGRIGRLPKQLRTLGRWAIERRMSRFPVR
jgi:glycosyl transferase family 25